MLVQQSSTSNINGNIRDLKHCNYMRQKARRTRGRIVKTASFSPDVDFESTRLANQDS